MATLYSRPATAEDTQPNETEQGHGCSQSEQMNVNQQELSPYTDIDTWEKREDESLHQAHGVGAMTLQRAVLRDLNWTYLCVV